MQSIDVSLEKKEAVVSYFVKKITPEAIAVAISDMGFDTSLLEVNGLKSKGRLIIKLISILYYIKTLFYYLSLTIF